MMTRADEIARLIAALDGPPEDRKRTQAQLVAIGEACIDPLIAALDAQEGSRAWLAAQLLGELRAARAVPSLAAALQSSNPLIGGAALESLRQYEDVDIVPLIVAALMDAHIIVQQSIVMALQHYKDPRTAKILLDLLDETGSTSLRCTVIRTLGEIGDREAIPAIRAYRDDDDHHIREWVMVALEQLGEDVDANSQGPAQHPDGFSGTP
jgi:HEAT repeat protein